MGFLMSPFIVLFIRLLPASSQRSFAFPILPVSAVLWSSEKTAPPGQVAAQLQLFGCPSY